LAFQSLRALQCQAEAEYANGLEFLQRCLKVCHRLCQAVNPS
ncbi:hypothetical protein T01_7546, partial [Trichinella spiralis]